jgi:hypothetical protein
MNFNIQIYQKHMCPIIDWHLDDKEINDIVIEVLTFIIQV